MITLEQDLAWKEATTRKREHWKGKLVVLKEKRVVENERMFIKEQMSNEKILRKSFDDLQTRKVWMFAHFFDRTNMDP